MLAVLWRTCDASGFTHLSLVWPSAQLISAKSPLQTHSISFSFGKQKNNCWTWYNIKKYLNNDLIYLCVLWWRKYYVVIDKYFMKHLKEFWTKSFSAKYVGNNNISNDSGKIRILQHELCNLMEHFWLLYNKVICKCWF